MITHSGRFILRVSRLTTHDIESLSRSFDIRQIAKIEPYRSILLYSFPTLDAELERSDPNHLPQKLQDTIVRVLVRAASRTSPFGFSSASAIGTITNETDCCQLVGAEPNWLTAPSGKAQALALNDTQSARKLDALHVMCTNPTLYTYLDMARYCRFSSSLDGSYRYEERSLNTSEKEILEYASISGHKRPTTLTILRAAYPRETLDGLIEAGLLIDGDGLRVTTSQYKPNSSGSDNPHVTAATAEIGAAGKEEPINGIGTHSSDMIVEGFHQNCNPTLSENDAQILLTASYKVIEATSRTNIGYERLRNALYERFDEEPVSLVEIADPKYGLLEQYVDRSTAREFTEAAQFDEALTSFLASAIQQNSSVIDLSTFSFRSVHRSKYPGGGVLAEMAIGPERSRFSMQAISVPTGIELFARQAAAAKEYEDFARSHISQLAIDHERAIDVVHLPSYNGLHAVKKPAFFKRHTAIPGATSSGYHHALNDLYVHVYGHDIFLLSSDGQQLDPYNVCAHDKLHKSNHPIYRILSLTMLTTDVGFYWPSAFAKLRKYPRVVVGDVCISPAMWQLSEAQISDIKRMHYGTNSLKASLCKFGIQNHIEVGKGDKFLPVLESSKPLWQSSKRLLSDPDNVIRECPLRSETDDINLSKSLKEEVYLPFSHDPQHVRKATSPYAGRRLIVSDRHDVNTQWLYYKIYANKSAEDIVVLPAIGELTSLLSQNGGISKWFFVRYSDPRPHIRLRLYLSEIHIKDDVRSVMDTLLAQLRVKRFIDKIAVEEYHPEYARFGGLKVYDQCTRLFQLESETAVSLSKDVHETGQWERYDDFAAFHVASSLYYASKLPGSDHSDCEFRDELTQLAAFEETSRSERGIANKFLKDFAQDIRNGFASQLSNATIASLGLIPTMSANVFTEDKSANGDTYRKHLQGVIFHMRCNRFFSNWSRSLEYRTLYLTERLRMSQDLRQ